MQPVKLKKQWIWKDNCTPNVTFGFSVSFPNVIIPEYQWSLNASFYTFETAKGKREDRLPSLLGNFFSWQCWNETQKQRLHESVVCSLSVDWNTRIYCLPCKMKILLVSTFTNCPITVKTTSGRKVVSVKFKKNSQEIGSRMGLLFIWLFYYVSTPKSLVTLITLQDLLRFYWFDLFNFLRLH